MHILNSCIIAFSVSGISDFISLKNELADLVLQ